MTKRRNENRERKKKKNGETEKRKTLGTTSIMIYFSKSNGVKKRGDTDLECKTGVKHNSK